MGTVHRIDRESDAREVIAKAFDDQRCYTAAALVRTGLPAVELENTLLLEVSTRYGLAGLWRRTMTRLVTAWAQGHTARVVAAVAAWERARCNACAEAVLDGGTGCLECTEVG